MPYAGDAKTKLAPPPSALAASLECGSGEKGDLMGMTTSSSCQDLCY